MEIAIIISLVLWLISVLQNATAKYGKLRWETFSFLRFNKRNVIVLTPRIKMLENEVLMLLQHDRNAAKRLIKQQNRMNPGRSYQWCLEKVIWDLERDRRR